jgi:transposase
VLYDRVAAIDVHKDMIKVAVRVPGKKRGSRTTDVLEYRTFYGVLQAMARELRHGRGVTHVVMEASGVYTEPVYYALTELDFTEVLVVNPAHVKALKGHKTDARDAVRLLDLYECGAVVRGSYIPSPDLKEVRDLVRYRVKTVQARTSEIQRLQKALESAGIKLDSVVSDITGMSSTAMIEALIDGERRGRVLAGLALGRLRTAGRQADLSMALEGRFTAHHALMCRLHLDRISMFDGAVGDLDAKISPLVARHAAEAELLKTIPGFGDVTAAGWLGAIGPAPHEHFATAERLASWVTLCPGNYISARKSRSGRTGDGGSYIKPLLVQAAWAAVRAPGRLQARFHRLVRKFGGPKNKGARKRAIIAVAHSLLKIAYAVQRGDRGGPRRRDAGEHGARLRPRVGPVRALVGGHGPHRPPCDRAHPRRVRPGHGLRRAGPGHGRAGDRRDPQQAQESRVQGAAGHGGGARAAPRLPGRVGRAGQPRQPAHADPPAPAPGDGRHLRPGNRGRDP